MESINNILTFCNLNVNKIFKSDTILINLQGKVVENFLLNKNLNGSLLNNFYEINFICNL